jgi:acetyl-CoA acetyltransferase
MTQRYQEKNCAITGIGQSDVSRGATKSALELTVDAAMEAIRDAGLSRDEVDGIASWPGAVDATTGFSPVGVPVLQDALRLKVGWYCGGMEMPGQYGAVFDAIGAISAGLCRNDVVAH